MNNRNHQKQEKHFIVDILFVLALFVYSLSPHLPLLPSEQMYTSTL